MLDTQFDWDQRKLHILTL